MPPPLPSVTATWHNAPYEAISPSRPELSAIGKTVIITGASGGIGRATAQAFDKAGASKIVLIGRNETKLGETQALLSCESSIHSVDVTDEKGIQEVAAMIGTWDVLMLSAGYLSNMTPIASSPVGEWWQSFETNIKGSMIGVKAFVPTARPAATIVALTSAAVFPAKVMQGLSTYAISKMALGRFVEFVAAENPGLRAFALQPGMIDTEIFRKSGARAETLPMDSVELPAAFMMWLSSAESGFLNGRTVWANWDVNELKQKAEEIQNGLLLTTGLNGWPFSP